MVGDNFGNDHTNLTNRITLNLCDLHVKQRGKGVAYRELLPSYLITICNFTVFPEFDGFISEFCMWRESGAPLNRSINAIVVELTKLSAIAKKPIAEMSEAEKWAIFFKFADNPKQRELINALAAEKEEIMQAVQILSNISQDEHEAARFRARRKFQQDVESNRIESYRMGKEEGELKGKVEAARKFLAMGLPIEQVAQGTSLPLEQVRALRA